MATAIVNQQPAPIISWHAAGNLPPSGGYATIDEMLNALQNPSSALIALIAKIRKRALTAVKHSELSDLKLKLPAVTVSARMSALGKDGFLEHSGFYVYDYDEIDDIGEKFDMLASCQLECLVAVFISPSGAGLKAILQGPVAATADVHKTAWAVGMSLLRGAVPLEIAPKDQAKEVSRLCYMSDCRAVNTLWRAEWYEPFLLTKPSNTGLANIENLERPQPPIVVGGMTLADVRGRLMCVAADCGYQEWMTMILAVAQTLGKTDEAKVLLEEWSQSVGGWSKADRSTFDALWKNAEQKTTGSGVDKCYIERVSRKAGYRDWFTDLRRKTKDTKNGPVQEIVACEYNIGLILDHHPELRGRIWHDEVTGAALLEPKAGAVLPKGGIIEEHLAWTIVEWLQTNWTVKVVAADGMMKAMFAKAHEHSRNKRREWLQSLKWDGVARINGLWVEGFGSPDTPLNRAVAETWMIAAAARTLRPGTDFQLVPILQGPQGKGKSLGISALCPERSWVIDSQVDMKSKAGYEVVRTGTIIELAELAAMGRAEVEAVKAFVSHRVISYRAPWDRQTHTLNVSWVFVGTTNEHEVLKDSTGNRRFVPIAAPGRQGYFENTVKWMEANRDQLWAEATCKAASVGNSVILPPENWEAARAVASEATVRDMAEDIIEELSANSVDGCEMRMSDIVAQVLGANAGSVTDQMRIGRYLHKYGWRRTTARREGKLTKLWVRTCAEL